MATCNMRLGSAALAPFPLVEAGTLDFYLRRGLVANLLSTFPSPAHVPAEVVARLPLVELCRDPSLHPYVGLWASQDLVDRRQVVEILIKQHQTKAAKVFAKRFKFPLQQFPTLLQASYEVSFSHWVFSEAMTYNDVAQLCVNYTEAVEAFVKWTKSRQPLAAQCVIALGVEDPKEQTRINRANQLSPISKEVALSVWNAGEVFFPIDEQEIPHCEPWQTLLYSNEKLTLRAIGLKLCNIELISTYKEFEDIFPHLESARILGMDCEWRPSFTGEHIFPVALFQMAVRHSVTQELHCYLIDIFTLRRAGDHEAVLRLIDEILSAETPLKLGCSFLSQDVGMLLRSTEQKQLFKRIENYVDIVTLVRTLIDPTFKGGMAKAAAEVLGVEMDKSQQCANWELRPLTLKQAIYAALDAATLVVAAERVSERFPEAKAFTTRSTKPSPTTNETASPVISETSPAVNETPSEAPREPGSTKSTKETSGKKTASKGTPSKDSSKPAPEGESGSVMRRRVEADLSAWWQEKQALEQLVDRPLPAFGLAVFRVAPTLTRALRSFGFPIISNLDRKKWSEIAQECIDSKSILLVNAKPDLEQLKRALAEDPTIPAFPYFTLTSSEARMKVRELLWLWELKPLSLPLGCLECGGFLRYEGVSGFRTCQSCNFFMWVDQLEWFSVRNESELLEFQDNIDSLALMEETIQDAQH